jgi:aromatic-amino-acid transaminase
MSQNNFFSAVEMAPADPIFGLRQKFMEDRRPEKIDLCVGVYLDEAGSCQKLDVVKNVEQELLAKKERGEIPNVADYMPIAGHPGYINAARTLLFGATSAALADGRIISSQAVGGTGALRYCADLFSKILPAKTILVSDPSWPVHRNIFSRAGYTVQNYPYYDARTHGLDIGGACSALKAAPKGSIVLLHACCHNPTGIDPSRKDLSTIIDIILEQGLFPLVDIAYQGFGEGLEEDAWLVRELDRRGAQFAVAQSFSKNLSLYNRRCGAFHVRVQEKGDGERLLSQLKTEIRVTNSNPPFDGAEIAATILTTPSHRAAWEQEVTLMRTRIQSLRAQFIDALAAEGLGSRFEFLRGQRGMFSYTGLSKEQSIRLREEFGVYILESGRICVAALNGKNLARSAQSVAAVLR